MIEEKILYAIDGYQLHLKEFEEMINRFNDFKKKAATCSNADKYNFLKQIAVSSFNDSERLALTSILENNQNE